MSGSAGRYISIDIAPMATNSANSTIIRTRAPRVETIFKFSEEISFITAN
jgi:hypothetical protein